jgi:hypothetical protein
MPQSKFQRWLYGDELAKRWNTSPLEIWALMVEGKLIPYNTVTFTRIFVSNEPWRWQSSGYKPGDERNAINNMGFKLEEIELFEKYQKVDQLNGDNIETKLRPNQRHRLQCRLVAEEIWKDNPDITIADMAQLDEINEVFEGKVYADKTIRIWINDLCPNRRPGRRPKPKV